MSVAFGTQGTTGQVDPEPPVSGVLTMDTASPSAGDLAVACFGWEASRDQPYLFPSLATPSAFTTNPRSHDVLPGWVLVAHHVGTDSVAEPEITPAVAVFARICDGTEPATIDVRCLPDAGPASVQTITFTGATLNRVQSEYPFFGSPAETVACTLPDDGVVVAAGYVPRTYDTPASTPVGWTDVSAPSGYGLLLTAYNLASAGVVPAAAWGAYAAPVDSLTVTVGFTQAGTFVGRPTVAVHTKGATSPYPSGYSQPPEVADVIPAATQPPLGSPVDTPLPPWVPDGGPYRSPT